jgi:endogenous inhibitor of DNA gyrase (YacG/DUF329 family)
MTSSCPTCKRRVEWNNNYPWRPFCSERCKLIDLGAWASERHVIPGDMQNMDDDLAANDGPLSVQQAEPDTK